MALKLFGVEIFRQREEEERQQPIPALKSFAPEITDDGAAPIVAGGAFGAFIDLDGSIRSEAEMITRYREMALQPEVDKAISEIVNEAIVYDQNKEFPVDIVLDHIEELSSNIKKIIREEFKGILSLLHFNEKGYDIFKRWYIDGRQYFHMVSDLTRPELGIQEIRMIDPRKIRKIREIRKTKDPYTGVPLHQTANEYFVYNDKGFDGKQNALIGDGSVASGIRIKADSVIYITSGIMDSASKTVLSYLHAAIKTLNQLRSIEDATLIYHLSRAPERRVFYVDVGNLPKMKAEQYLKDLMQSYKNKLTYDSITGEIKDNRKFPTMLEDFWLPRREGSTGTEIDTISGGTALPDLLQTVEFFQDRLLRSLNVPLSRMKPDALYSIGKATEISKDETNFQKFIDRLRTRFNSLYLEALEKQLVMKNILPPEAWDEIKNSIRFTYNRDIVYAEMKELEILSERLFRLDAAMPYAGKMFPIMWLRKNILKQTDEEIEEMDAQMAAEMQAGMYGIPDEEPNSSDRAPQKDQKQ